MDEAAAARLVSIPPICCVGLHPSRARARQLLLAARRIQYATTEATAPPPPPLRPPHLAVRGPPAQLGRHRRVRAARVVLVALVHPADGQQRRREHRARDAARRQRQLPAARAGRARDRRRGAPRLRLGRRVRPDHVHAARGPGRAALQVLVDLAVGGAAEHRLGGADARLRRQREPHRPGRHAGAAQQRADRLPLQRARLVGRDPGLPVLADGDAAAVRAAPRLAADGADGAGHRARLPHHPRHVRLALARH